MGVKYFCTLAMVCFAVSFASSTFSSSSVERETSVAESYEEPKSSPYDDDSALEATHDGGDHQLKRDVPHADRSDMGHETSDNRPYFMHRQVQRHQNRQQPPQHQQQQPMSAQHYQQQHQSHQYRGPVTDHFGFGSPSSAGRNEHTDSFYQTGGGENINFDSTGYTDFVPSSVGFRAATVSPAVPSSPLSPFTATPAHRQPYDGGSSDQLFDPTVFGHEPPSAGYSSGGGGGGHNGYDYAPPQHQTPVVHKSVYVHVAPPDDEPPRKQRVIYPNAPPKKNYQIVFIKAPTAPPLTAPIIPPPQQTADKTLIYVLHPRPEEAPPIHIPPPPVTQPLKPEVYFIKYKNHREESSAHGGGGGGDYGPSNGGGDFGHSSVGGSLPSPGEEFGGGDTSSSGGYVHRRYGRGDLQTQSSTLPPSTDTSAAAASSSDDDDDRVRGKAVGQPDEAAAEVDPTVTSTGQNGSPELSSGGYSVEYNDDTSVDSTNLSETHLPSITVSKGKNGH